MILNVSSVFTEEALKTLYECIHEVHLMLINGRIATDREAMVFKVKDKKALCKNHCSSKQ